MTVRTTALALVSLAALSVLGGCGPPGSAITPRTIDQIEAALPPLAGVAPRARYYALGGPRDDVPPGWPGYREQHGRLLIGLWLKPDTASERPGLHIVPRRRLPVVYDGRCNVAHIVYDLDARRLLAWTCGGEA
jgi:hypothetical protein